MKEIHSISNTGLVLFVDETKRGATTQGTQEDCLAYAFKYQSGACFAYSKNVTNVEQNVNVGNVTRTLNGKNRVLGDANTIETGRNSTILGTGNKVVQNGSNSVLKGRNGYSENFGENVYSVSNVKDRARYVEIHYTGTTTDDTETELFIGGEGSQRFIANPDYATCYFIQYYATALNAASGEIWTRQNFVAYRNIIGSLQEVGNHSAVTLRDSNLDYDISIDDFGGQTYNHIAVNVTGEANHDVVWNVVLQITEVRIKETIGSNVILNKSFEELGTEMVDILSATGGSRWTNRTQNGVDFIGGSITALRYLQNVGQGLTNGKIYRLQYDLQDYTGTNDLGFSTSAGVPNTARLSANGSVDIYFEKTATGQPRLFGRENENTGNFRNVTIKEVDPNGRWTAGGDWEIEYGKAVVSSGSGDLESTVNLVSGTAYQIEFTILSVTGKLSVHLGNNTDEVDFVTTGVHRAQLVATSNLTFVANNTSAEITLITVKEISYGI